MKKIKTIKGLKVKDWIFFKEDIYNEEEKNLKYLAEIKRINKKGIRVKWFSYEDNLQIIFDKKEKKEIKTGFSKIDLCWCYYKFFKLNKAEIKKYKTKMMLSELEK